MAMVSPGRMGVGVGWETISLIEGKELKRDSKIVVYAIAILSSFSLFLLPITNILSNVY